MGAEAAGGGIGGFGVCVWGAVGWPGGGAATGMAHHRHARDTGMLLTLRIDAFERNGYAARTYMQVHGIIACPAERWQLDARAEGLGLPQLRGALAQVFEVRRRGRG